MLHIVWKCRPRVPTASGYAHSGATAAQTRYSCASTTHARSCSATTPCSSNGTGYEVCRFRSQSAVNAVEIANHSDGVAFDKIIVTNDPAYLPEGLGEGVTRFYDGFAGCDADNTGSWEFLSGTWRIVRGAGDAAAAANDCVAQWAPEGGVAVTGYTAWKDYDMKVNVMFSDLATAGILFGRRDGQHEYRLLWSAAATQPRLMLTRLVDGQTTTLAEGPAPAAQCDRWYALGFERQNGGTASAGRRRDRPVGGARR